MREIAPPLANRRLARCNLARSRACARNEHWRSAAFACHQLTLLCTVAQHLSYTRAAEHLYLSQPAVSQQVKALEQQLGLPLFVRQGRGIVLTPAGRELQQHAERLLALFADLAPFVQDIHQIKRGSVASISLARIMNGDAAHRHVKR